MSTTSGTSGVNSIDNNPLLQSTFEIRPAPSIGFAVVYGIFMVVMIFRLIRKSGRKFAYVLMAMVAAIRVVTFVMRYEVTKTAITDDSFNNIAIAAGVLIIAGFFLFLEAILELIVQWFLLCRQITISLSTRHLSHFIRHMTLAGISGIGIAGSVILAESFTETISESTYNTANDLRIASGALFLVATVIMLGLVLGSTFTARSTAPITNKGPTTAALLVLVLCCILESCYRLVSAVKHHGWIVSEQAVDVLVFMPELIALIIFSVMDFSDMGDVGFWNGKERKRSHGQNYVQNGDHHHSKA